MALNFKPKPGKPHIRVRMIDFRFYLWIEGYTDHEPSDKLELAIDYCCRVNPRPQYKTPGEAARALHYGSEKK